MSKTYDFSKLSRDGYLPVRILSHNYISWFLEITPDFKSEYEYEVNSNDLKKAIKYLIEQKKITDVAEVSKENGIEINENFCQFLWCCCYSIFVIFDEGIQKPTLNKTFDGNFLDKSNSYIKDAISVFDAGFGLFNEYNEKDFFNLPNPEKYSENDRHYVERTNGIFSSAMTFILLHEFGHQYYGHLIVPSDDKQSKKDELLVDNYAYDQMSTRFRNAEGITYQCGIIAGISSLIFFDDKMDGGKRHPDPDFRLKNLIEKMELNEIDNLWCIASLPFNLWANKYNKVLKYDKYVENYKELFYITMEQIALIKGSC